MPSTIGWIDYDDEQRDSMRRVLAFFRERESRDELGLGSIRDAIAEQMFPGTGTLQTRARYMLFVPWMYQQLEAQRMDADQVAQKARRIELGLVEALLEHGPDGVIGRVARSQLKTLPSAIYWAGLSSWGILRYGASQSSYHKSFGRIAQRRSQGRRREDIDVADETALTWHGGLPDAPDDFPKAASFALSRQEAEYLRDRVREEHPTSLLAWILQEGGAVPDDGFIWDHPSFASFRPEHRELVHHARVFSEVMQGAAILYNLSLGRLRDDKDTIAAYTEALAEWVGLMADPQVCGRNRDLNLDRFWDVASNHFRHAISASTREFVAQWFEFARAATVASVDSEAARGLVRQRERALKKSQSRFDNRVALGQWSGASGLAQLGFRWNNARVIARDIRAGMRSEEG